MDVKYGIRLLDRFGLSRALVTEAGQLAGIVTLHDMVLRGVAPKESEAGQFRCVARKALARTRASRAAASSYCSQKRRFPASK